MAVAGQPQPLSWWTVRECANRWRVSPSTVTRWLEAGKLAGKRFGSQWRVSSEAVAAFEADGFPKWKPAEPTPGTARDWGAAPEYV